MKNKGQALVEFIVVIPVFILIICGAIEIGNIIYKKYQMEEYVEIVSELYKKDKTDEMNDYLTDNKLTFTTEEENNFLRIEISKSIKISTPILSNILGKDYSISVDRVIYYE